MANINFTKFLQGLDPRRYSLTLWLFYGALAWLTGDGIIGVLTNLFMILILTSLVLSTGAKITLGRIISFFVVGIIAYFILLNLNIPLALFNNTMFAILIPSFLATIIALKVVFRKEITIISSIAIAFIWELAENLTILLGGGDVIQIGEFALYSIL